MIKPLILAAMLALHGYAAAGPWTASWGAAPDSAGKVMRDETVRQLVRVSAGGPAVRIALSNAFGEGPVTIGPVSVGQHPVLFGGRSTVTIAKGASAVSDAVDVAVKPLEELAVTLHVNGAATPTIHSDARQTAWLGADGKINGGHRYFLSDVQVKVGMPSVVVVGDSISDGYESTPDRNARWPDALAARLPTAGVVNSGISGNRLLNDGPVGESMLRRFDRDALDKEGVRWIVLEAGLNDIALSGDKELSGGEVSAAQVIAGLKELAARAHAKGIQVWGTTLTPYGGAVSPLRHNPVAEAKRLAVNAWIRGSYVYDRVLDFDAAVRDPKQPSRLAPQYDSGDHIHPNDAGYRALAESVPLSFFTR